MHIKSLFTFYQCSFCIRVRFDTLTIRMEYHFFPTDNRINTQMKVNELYTGCRSRICRACKKTFVKFKRHCLIFTFLLSCHKHQMYK